MLTDIPSLLLASALSATAASASETQTYSYDSQGRLVSVTRSGSINNGVQSHYTHDGADSRSNLSVTGTGRSAPANSGMATARTASNDQVTAMGHASSEIRKTR